MSDAEDRLFDVSEIESISAPIRGSVGATQDDVDEGQISSFKQKLNQLQFRLKLKVSYFTKKILVQFQQYYQRVSFFFRRHLDIMARKRSSSRRSSRLKKTQQSLQRVKLMRFLALGSVVAMVVGIVAFFALFAYFSRDLPKPGEVLRREGFSTKLYDRHGELLYDLFDEERRDPVAISDAPQHLRDATVAIEDKDFYKHQGFDVLTVFRIPYNMLFRQRVVGGSTLTQQLVKNVLLTNERSIQRKFKELVLSLQIERTFSKEQILEMYLNEAPYGGTAWGVGSASQTYFNKPVAELTLLESAILAGLPQRPSAYSPYAGKTDTDGELLWHIRTRGVLNAMRNQGYITDPAYEEALSELDSVQFTPSTSEIAAPHFVFYVIDQLEELLGEEVVAQGGFTVTTSLDLELHTQAQNIVSEEIEAVEELNITNGATVVIDPNTGEILSMVGSRDYSNSDIGGQFNVVVDALRQPGSAIKPVTYLAMLQKGYTPASVLMDVQTKFQIEDNQDAYEPGNYDGKFRGPVSLRNSLGSSLNIPAVKSLAVVGLEPFLTLADSLGLETLAPTEENFNRFGLAVTLGGAEVHMLDLAEAYSSFANGGYKVEPVSILKIQDADAEVIFEHRTVQGPQIISSEETFLINSMLSDNSARSIAFGSNSLLNTGKPVAVKTGTTNDQRDNWAIGWSQDVLVAAWVGNNDNSQMKSVASGVSGATPIWRKVLFAAFEQGYEAPAWSVPSGVEEVLVDRVSGYPEHDEFDAKKEYVIKGTLPPLPDPIHSKLKLCRGEEKLATDAKVAAGDYDEKEYFIFSEEDPVSQDGKNRWQEAIDAWVAAQEDSRYSPPTEYCGDVTEVYVKIGVPQNQHEYEEEDLEVRVDAESPSGIEKIEIYVDDQLRETVEDRKYRSTIHFPAGQHTLLARAYSRDGKTKDSYKIAFGTGGQPWEKPAPTPTPTPTPSLTPTPELTPTPTSTPVVTPSINPDL